MHKGDKVAAIQSLLHWKATGAKIGLGFLKLEEKHLPAKCKHVKNVDYIQLYCFVSINY